MIHSFGVPILIVELDPVVPLSEFGVWHVGKPAA